jgi:DNA-binding NtrC family response regulator
MGARHLAARQSSTVIVGQSLATIRLRAEIERVAPFSSNVLITGPSGTGKELVARRIHERSPRSHEAFIPVDCASMSGELMASQLFGHVAGAFTGANCDALGCFRAADGGTIFLDEIGELEYSLQAKLLRVLQEHVVTPVGSHQGERVDVRVVAATNRNLRLDVLEGRFREDLYYRLDVVHLRTAALRERPGDICELAKTFLGQLAGEGLPECSLAPEASAALAEFPWPGNVRQLRNVLEQAAIDSDSPVIEAGLLQRIMSLSLGPTDSESPQIDAPAATTAQEIFATVQPPTSINRHARSPSEWLSLEEIERDHIVRTLEHTFNNRSAAARLLGVTRQSLLRKMKRHGLD